MPEPVICIRLDEHIAYRITANLGDVITSPDIQISHVLDYYKAGMTDVAWLTAFASEGGVAILTADNKMMARPQEILAIAQTGLIGVFLDKNFNQAKRQQQNDFLIEYWPMVEQTIRAAGKGTFYKMSFKNAKITKIEIPVAEIVKKINKTD